MLPAYELNVRVAETNKVATMPVRGRAIRGGVRHGAPARPHLRHAWHPRAEVRERNLVPPEKMPYVTPLKPGRLSHRARQRRLPALPAQGDGGDRSCRLPRRQQRAREAGRYLGLGIANGVKGTGRGPFESAIVRIGRSGRISLYTGAMPMGQGIKTALAQICADQFGVPPDTVSVTTGDTAVIPYGQGGFASRQTVTAGSSVHLAAAAVREKAMEVAAHLLEASTSDLELRDGRIEIAGAGKRPHPARGGRGGLRRTGLSHAGKFSRGSRASRASSRCADLRRLSHAVELEVDEETGAVRILRYVVVNDSGRIINPMIAEGQIMGGVAHAIGNALLELMAYDEQAQPVTTSFAEYLLASATEVPNVEVSFVEFPSPLNPLGVKGVGESGCVPAAAAIVSAIESALSPFGVRITEYPVTPARLFALLQNAKA
jgi:carbon-monoxide dehydrogenase large subunit